MVKEEKSFALEVSTCKLWGGQNKATQRCSPSKVSQRIRMSQRRWHDPLQLSHVLPHEYRYSYHRTCQDYGQLITKRIYIKKSGLPIFLTRIVQCIRWLYATFGIDLFYIATNLKIKKIRHLIHLCVSKICCRAEFSMQAKS